MCQVLLRLICVLFPSRRILPLSVSLPDLATARRVAATDAVDAVPWVSMCFWVFCPFSILGALEAIILQTGWWPDKSRGRIAQHVSVEVGLDTVCCALWVLDGGREGGFYRSWICFLGLEGCDDRRYLYSVYSTYLAESPSRCTVWSLVYLLTGLYIISVPEYSATSHKFQKHDQ